MSARDSESVYSDADLGSTPPIEDDIEPIDGTWRRHGAAWSSPTAAPLRTMEETRHWRDVFWLCIFVLHLVAFGCVLALFGINRFHKANRLNISVLTNITGGAFAGRNSSRISPVATSLVQPPPLVGDSVGRVEELTETYWPFYGVAAGAGTLLAWGWLALLGSQGSHIMKISVHSLTTYLAVISVLCFWMEHFFWGIVFAVGAALQFMYVMAVMDRIPFTMLVLQKAVKMVSSLPEIARVAYAFILVMLSWMGLWSFGVSGVVATGIEDDGCWWLLVVSRSFLLVYFGRVLYFATQFMS